MTQHSPVGPSAAHRWLNCPGSVALSRGIADKASVYAAQGTAMHEVAAWCLQEQRVARERVGQIITVGEFQVEVDEDLAEAAQTYVDNLHNVYGWLNEDQVRGVEWPLPFGRALGIGDEHVGTADAVIVRGTEAQIHDLKGGRGHRVMAEDNPQLMLYALALVEEYSEFFDLKTVRLVIHQPKLDHLDEAVYSVEHLLGDFRTKARAAASRALALHSGAATAVDADFAPDASTCQWCRAKAQCKALQGTVNEVVGADVTAADFSSIQDPADLAVDQLANAFARLGMVRMWADAIEAKVRENLDNGIDVPGYKLVAGRRGAREWTQPAAVEQILRESMRLTHEEVYNSKLRTPAQLEKVLRDQPKRWARLEEFIGQPDCKPCVVPVSDRREALPPVRFSEDA